jgi:hypothetical protein
MNPKAVPWRKGEVEHLMDVLTGRKPSGLTDAQRAAETKRARKMRRVTQSAPGNTGTISS